MKNGLYIGIDPGSSTGGIAFIRTFIGFPDDVFATGIGKFTERDLFGHLHGMVQSSTLGGEQFCIIEKVWPFPGQGISSSFNFGGNYKSLRMALIALSIPFDECSSMKWQKYYGMKKKIIGKDEKDKNILESVTDWKRRLRQKAEQLFPKIKMTNNLADALLLADYCKHLKY